VGFTSVRTEWESYSCLTGTEVRVQGPGGEVAGRVLGLDDDGALRLRAGDGRVNRVVAGEVTLRGRRGD
jgi:BirA family biotin operon repressor/biotin-[acetyl-CoA-carboxylase] ligase